MGEMPMEVRERITREHSSMVYATEHGHLTSANGHMRNIETLRAWLAGVADATHTETTNG